MTHPLFDLARRLDLRNRRRRMDKETGLHTPAEIGRSGNLAPPRPTF